MKELLARLFSRPVLSAEMIAASLFANVLALASPIFVIQVLNRYVAHGVDATLATLTAGVAIAIALELAFRHLRMRIAASVNASYDRAVAQGAFGTLITAKSAAIEQLPPGVRQEMVAGAEKLQVAYNATNICTVLDVPFALLFIGVLFLLNPTIAVVVSGFVAFGFLVSVITLATLRKPSREMQMTGGKRGGIIGTAIQSGDTVRAFNGGAFLREQWKDETGVFHKLYRTVTGRQGFLQSFGMTTQALMSVAVIVVGALQVVAGTMDVGAMIGANILGARALGPVIKFAMMSESLAKARQALNLFQEFAKLPREKAEGTALSEYKGSIDFQDVALVHPGSKTPLFESVNLRLEPGSVLVFAGSNGAGKTTMARLLVGLLEPTRGKILADGVDLQQIAPEWWRKQIVYLPQEPKFLNATLAENIRVANPDLEESELNALIDRAGIRTFVDQSADGPEMMITGGGANLSLGIRRRLALARAMATDGMLVIIDEPTEGLDNEGSQSVFDAMNHLAGRGRTVLAFSHDPQILRAAPHYVDLNAKPVPNLIRRPADITEESVVANPAGGETQRTVSS